MLKSYVSKYVFLFCFMDHSAYFVERQSIAIFVSLCCTTGPRRAQSEAGVKYMLTFPSSSERLSCGQIMLFGCMSSMFVSKKNSHREKLLRHTHEVGAGLNEENII